MNTQKEIAYALRSGRIEFSPLPEKEHRGIAICPELAGHPRYRETIETWARLAYDNKTLLVPDMRPDVPAAKDGEADLGILDYFCQFIKCSLTKRYNPRLFEPGDRVRLVPCKGLIFGVEDLTPYRQAGEMGTIIHETDYELEEEQEQVIFDVQLDHQRGCYVRVNVVCLELVEKGGAA